jgi:flagellar hook-associated protein 3 FlgL
MTISSRYTTRLMVDRSLASMQAGLGRLARTQEQLHTGRIINRPSDSPIGTNTAMRLRSETAAQNQYVRNADDGLGWLGQIDDTLTSMLDSVRRARGHAMQGATGSTNAQSREALAAEVEQLREGLIQQANTKYLDRPVFGGTTTGKQAYDPDTGAFVGRPSAGPGTGTTVERTVAEGMRVRVDVTGPEVFGSGSSDLFAVLDDVVTHLRTDPSALGGDLDALDDAMGRIQTALSDVGTRYGRVEKASQTAKDVTLNLQTSLSEVENVDLAKAMMDLQIQEVAYQAALATTGRVLQPSLLSFLQ